MKRIILCAVAILAFMQTGLCAGKESYDIKKDIAYKTGAGLENCKLDVASVKDSKEALPVLVWFHGGGLTGGKKSFPTGVLDGKTVVVTVEYRLYPQAQVPEILDDCAAAIAWTFSNIEKFGGNKSKVFVSGMSAGAYISAMMGTAGDYLKKYGFEPSNLAGIIPVSGQMITHFTHRKSQGLTYEQPTIDALAPLYHVTAKGIPPMLLITGDRTMDMKGRYEENAFFKVMLIASGHKDVTLYELQGFGHKGILVTSSMPLIHNWIEKH